MALFDHPQQRTIFRWIVFALAIAALATFAPLWVPLVLAVWISTLTRPLLAKLAKVTRGRRRAAGALVVLLVMLMVLPLAAIIASLVSGAIDLDHISFRYAANAGRGVRRWVMVLPYQSMNWITPSS